MLVISRLLHKSLSQRNDTPPFVENLKTQLASLRRKLLAHIDRRFANMDTGTHALVEAMCAFSLATSSLPKDVLRHFLHVRREAMTTRLEKGGGRDGSVVMALRTYIRTLQDTRTVFPKRLADSLAKLKAQPLLKDADVRGLVEFSLDVHERWIAGEVRNFTPWVKHEDLQEAEVERVLKEWARKAFTAFTDGFKMILEDANDLKALVELRKDLLETWLSANCRYPGLSSSEVLDDLRSTINSQLSHVIHDIVHRLDSIGSEISRVIERWEPGVTDSLPALWDPSMTNLEVSNGAAAFKQALLDRSHGRNEAVIRVLGSYNLWLRSVEEVEVVIKGLKSTRWDVDLEADDEDELGLVSKQVLSEDDPRALQAGFETALREALRGLENQIQTSVNTFPLEERAQQAMFILRVVREIRQRLPKAYVNQDFGLIIVPEAQQMVVEMVLKNPVSTCGRVMERRSRSGRVLGRALWEGTPELPVQPSATIFRLLHDIVLTMAQVGNDIWSPDAVDILKKELRARILNIIESGLKPQMMEDKMNGLTEEGKDQIEGTVDQTRATNGEVGDADWDIQLLFDVLFLQQATKMKSKPAKDGLSALSGRIYMQDDSRDRVGNAAVAYWKRTSLLFALLA